MGDDTIRKIGSHSERQHTINRRLDQQIQILMGHGNFYSHLDIIGNVSSPICVRCSRVAEDDAKRMLMNWFAL